MAQAAGFTDQQAVFLQQMESTIMASATRIVEETRATLDTQYSGAIEELRHTIGIGIIPTINAKVAEASEMMGKIEQIVQAGSNLRQQLIEAEQRSSNIIAGLNTVAAQVAADRVKVDEWSKQVEAATKLNDEHLRQVKDLQDVMHVNIDEKEVALEAKLNKSFDMMQERMDNGFALSERKFKEAEVLISRANDAFNSVRNSGGKGGTMMGDHKQSKKDFAVRDLSEKADVQEFRKWLKTVELQLEAIYDMKNFDLIVEKIRICQTAITPIAWASILEQVNATTPGAVNALSWDFEEKSRWLYHYLITKLNTRLFTATAHVRGKNGFEVLRIVNKVMDRVPENATFQADLQLGQAITKDGKISRCTTIKDTVNMAALLEAACTNYRRNTATEPEQKRLKELIWQVLDPETLSKFMEKEFDSLEVE